MADQPENKMPVTNMSFSDATVERAYALARERYAELGVDTDAVIEFLKRVPISMHCWQGDDVGGFEGSGAELGSGLAVTGNYPGRARTPSELRSDLELAYSLIPGQHRLNLHASYGEFPKKVDRDEVDVGHFHGWMEWAKTHHIGLDFNPTYFAHPLASDGFTLAHADPAVRQFWIHHGQACRRIAAAIGKAQGSPCVNNVWIPTDTRFTLQSIRTAHSFARGARCGLC